MIWNICRCGRREILGCGEVAQRCEERSFLSDERSWAARGCSPGPPGLYGISGGRLETASPEIVASELRASSAMRLDIPAVAGRRFSQSEISSVVSESSVRFPHFGWMKRVRR